MTFENFRYVNRNLYAVTVSPPFRKGRPKVWYEYDSYGLHQHFNKFSKHYMFVPEFDNNSRIHYHGVVRIDDSIKHHKTKYILDKSIGYSKFDPLKTLHDHIRWLIYCNKNQAPFDRIIYKRLHRGGMRQAAPSLDYGIVKALTEVKAVGEGPGVNFS